MECELMLCVKNHIPYLWNLSNSFSNSFNDFYSCEGFHQEIYQKEWSIKLCVENGVWHESLNLLHVSGCEMLHFVTSYMKQNKSRKQTLESAQYGLEISLKALVNEDTLLPMMFLGLRKLGNICCGHNVSEQNQKLTFFVSRTQNWCPQQMFRAQTNGKTFVSAAMCPRQCVRDNVSATMCPRLPGPLHFSGTTFVETAVY